jgi:hypothetical protein
MMLPAVYAAIQQHTGAQQERYASPLNYQATTKAYWSAHRRDRLFGAMWDTHRYICT